MGGCQLLVGRKLVTEYVGIGSHDGVTDLYGPTFQVVGGAYEPKHGSAGGEAQYTNLFRRRHPRGHFLREALQGVTEFLDPPIDAPGPRIRIGDRCAVSDVCRDVRDSSLHRLPIEGIPPATHDDRRSIWQLKEIHELRRRQSLADLDHVDVRFGTDLIRLHDEGSFALFAVTSSKAVRGQPPYRRTRTYEASAAVFRHGQPLGLQA